MYFSSEQSFRSRDQGLRPKPFFTKTVRLLTVSSLTVISAALVVSCGNAEGTAAKSKTASAEVQGPSLQTGRVNRGEIAKIINATGSVRPDITVQVGSEVSGKLLTVDVDFNSAVEKGDILAVIDPENLENNVAQSEALVESRQSDIRINTASLKRTEVNLAQAERSLNRQQQLYAENAISQAQLEETEKAMLLADADVELAKARLEGSRSSLKQAQADLRTARVDLSRTKIKAPIKGVVIERLVDPGQTVAASFSAPELFKIAGDLSKIKIDAAIVESDVSGLDSGDPVTFSVDAYPGRVFRGEVDQLRLKSETTSNIVTYTAVINSNNADRSLMPGMTTNLQITTNSKTGILRIPAAAERFRPTPDQIQMWKAEGGEKTSADLDPKTTERLKALGLENSRIDRIMGRMADETVSLREQIADPTQTWRKVTRQKELRDTYDSIVKKELSSPEYQEYLRLVQADAQIRDAQIWIKDGEKMRQIEVGLGLSDGSFVEVISGVSEGDEVVTGIGTARSGGRSAARPRG